MMSSASLRSQNQNFVLVVDNLGDTEILNLSYDVNWTDLAVMLQVKFDYEDKPQYTYTDEDDDFICLDNQEAYEEALKVCKRNSDVLHIQVRKSGFPLVRPTTQQPSSRNEDNEPSPPTRDHVEMARNAVGSTLGWASKAVKSAFNEFGRGILTTQVKEDVCMETVPSSSNVDEMVTNNENEGVPTTSEVPHDDPVLHEVDDNSETVVKEPLDSHLTDISVDTSLISSSGESEVKMPIASTYRQNNYSTEEESKHADVGNEDMLDKFREEVRAAISQELSAFRNEISTSIAQNLGNKRSMQPTPDENLLQSTSSTTTDGPRSPRRIKVEIKQLRKEMKEAKQLKKLKKSNEREKAPSPDNNSPLKTDMEKKARKYAASFICENLLDGSCVRIGQQFVKYWVLKNDGTITWDHVIELRLIEEDPAYVESAVDPESCITHSGNSGDDVERRWGPDRCSVCMPIVDTGATAVIAVSYTAPNFPCRYISQWRLSHNGRPFGPRIWCSVEVKSTVDIQEPEIESMSLAESEQEVSVAMKNQIPQRSVSNENVLERICDEDNLSSMLSFEMTGVGDFNKMHSSELGEYKHSFAYTGPSSIRSESKSAEPEAVQEIESTAIVDNEEPGEEMEVKEQSSMVEEIEVQEPPQEEVLSDIESLEEVAENTEATDEKQEEEREEAENLPNENEAMGQTDEKSSDEIDETGSDAMSDFEVIPLPECFDTSRPLSRGEKSLENEEKSTSLHSGSTVIEVEKKTVVDPSKEPVTARNDEKMEEVPEDCSLDATDCVPFDTEDSAPKVVVVSSSSQCPSTSNTTTLQATIPAPFPVPQSVLDQDKSIALGSDLTAVAREPITVPQSVLNLDEPCPVEDYSKGYSTSPQITARSHEDGWVSQPIPLPRGVLDADKPWVRPEQSGSTIPSPRPRQISSSSPSRSRQRPWDAAASLEASIDTTPPASVDISDEGDSPQIYYPPDNENGDEFILAPVVAAYPDCPSQVLMPPEDITSPRDEIPRAGEESSPIEQLVDMGFLDIDLNNDLLKEFNNDVNRVVHALVYGEARSLQRSRERRRRTDGSFLA